jgi:hypothetical protein
MGRKAQCSSCLYWFPGYKLPRKLFEVFCPLYDGWCKEKGEERDRDEEVCSRYTRQIRRSKD